ncbi:hypothetical protein BDY19DRAFT_517804 [Irpex rosettiformis]|uniref:Uncharacterized protein n=1 Tax=Irpex rosettiformis TaxID=378272 RepID=A0ACB8TS27_9APHY|nr:hypothetical protein BDY19DRAFT_517804 [Irpex rosettiformis]
MEGRERRGEERRGDREEIEIDSPQTPSQTLLHAPLSTPLPTSRGSITTELGLHNPPIRIRFASASRSAYGGFLRESGVFRGMRFSNCTRLTLYFYSREWVAVGVVITSGKKGGGGEGGGRGGGGGGGRGGGAGGELTCSNATFKRSTRRIVSTYSYVEHKKDRFYNDTHRGSEIGGKPRPSFADCVEATCIG